MRSGLRWGCSEVRLVEGGAKPAALKSEDRNPKPEGRPKLEIRKQAASEGRRMQKSRGFWCQGHPGSGGWLMVES